MKAMNAVFVVPTWTGSGDPTSQATISGTRKKIQKIARIRGIERIRLTYAPAKDRSQTNWLKRASAKSVPKKIPPIMATAVTCKVNNMPCAR
ncbi:hypothetical protein D3C84_956000 [compost metagenome]